MEPKAAAASVACPVSTYEVQLSAAPAALIVPETITVVRKKKEKTLAVADFLVGPVELDGDAVRFTLEAKPTGSLRADAFVRELLAATVAEGHAADGAVREKGTPMDDCLFCKIVAGDIPSAKVYEDDICYAFDDIEPEAPVHTLIVPKVHYDNLADGVPAEVIGHMMAMVPEVARLKGVGESGYRTVVNTGPDSAATVGHLHIHVLGGTKMGRFTFEGSLREA